MSNAVAKPEPDIFDVEDDDYDELGEVLAEAASRSPSFTAAYEDAASRNSLLRQLIKVRKDLRISQKSVAERMQTTQSAVSDLENGNVDPHLSTLQRYARALTVRLVVGIDMPHDSPWCDARFYSRSPSSTRLKEVRTSALASSNARNWRSSTPAAPVAHLDSSRTRLVGAL
ncbi:helix-turn-helix transcriptional regulator [Micromonospora sp. WMMD987]|uniref:helix-turn-helix domain-containing protein n=1 Tax=Micromonospora sp. WMMD987 TaxID=3016089 RepID=UPI00249AD096|nr:helix-turn-helix transcriptional regulator [Micromonospora sp. WMMD987]WFE95642.1 helix-turn-helix transcriptional regulator [Micromonospora sp. WMMD987]